jgi:hypothetical protein
MHDLEYLIVYSDWLGVGRLGSDFLQGQFIPLPHRLHTGSVAHLASYSVGTGGTRLNLVPKLRMKFHIRLNGIVVN